VILGYNTIIPGPKVIFRVPYSMEKISFVIPVFNEEDNIAELHKNIVQICEHHKLVCEIIIVDDGSQDGTSNIVKSLFPVKYIRFRKNFGQTAAIDAGIKNAKYDLIITMDGDGQNDPGDIPRLIHHIRENNFDVVSGWRKLRHDPLSKRIISLGAKVLRRIIINDGIHDSGCTLKIYKRECFYDLTLYGEMHRFIPALLKIRGFKIGEIEVNHKPRVKNSTKYNWKRIVKGFLDMLAVWFWNKFAVRPLHLLGGAGILTLLVGLASGITTFVLFIRGVDLSSNVFPLLTAFLLLSGMQLFVFGLIGDMLAKNYYRSANAQHYFIQEQVENKNHDDTG
jgi:glycosyltransferase involved in cell wall biosynthesis